MPVHENGVHNHGTTRACGTKQDGLYHEINIRNMNPGEKRETDVSGETCHAAQTTPSKKDSVTCVQFASIIYGSASIKGPYQS